MAKQTEKRLDALLKARKDFVTEIMAANDLYVQHPEVIDRLTIRSPYLKKSFLKDSFKEISFFADIERNNIQNVKKFLDKYPEWINKVIINMTPLEHAFISEKTEMAKYLIQRGAYNKEIVQLFQNHPNIDLSDPDNENMLGQTASEGVKQDNNITNNSIIGSEIQQNIENNEANSQDSVRVMGDNTKCCDCLIS